MQNEPPYSHNHEETNVSTVADLIDACRTQDLASFVASLKAASIPASVLDATRTFVLDGTGALLAAANPAYSTGRLIAGFVRDLGGHPQCSVIGFGFRTSPVNAALANGTMGYACDIEPHHPEAILHPIAVILPTALAVGEMVEASGADFLAAVALGCEIEYRTSMALGPAEQYALGFHPSAVCGAFGATAAAAFLLRLNDDAVVRAFGLAACQASGLMAWESDATENARPFQMGMAARNGVTAALLARSGFGGPIAVFDRGHTVFGAFSRNPRPENLLKDLGSRWDGVMELAIKPYSCVSFLHPALDAVLDIVTQEDLQPDHVAEVVMRFPKAGVHCVDGNPLKSHCAQYILPVAIVNRELRIADIFIDQRVKSEAVARLYKRVRVIADEELNRLFPDAYATVIEISTEDGRRFRRRNDLARGYPESPMSDAEIEQKFRTLVAPVTTQARAAELLAVIRDLPKAQEIHPYAQLLREPVAVE